MSLPVRRVWMAMALVLVIAACSDDGGTVFGTGDTKESSTSAGSSTSGDSSSTSSSSTTTTTAVITSTESTLGSTTSVSSAECSASDMSAVPVEQNLEEEAYVTRQAIVAAAVACDYQALGVLSANEFFAYDPGIDGNQASYWQEQEEWQTGTPLVFLVETLNLPFARVEVEGYVSYVWPAAYAAATWAEVPAAEQAALVALYGADISADWTDHGQFDHYRVSIDFQGTWMIFMTGV